VKAGNATLSGYGTTIFEAMSALARQHSAVNLGQGFPDDRGPLALRKAAAEYVIDGHNQYPPMMGLPALRQAVAAHDRRCYGLEVDWQTEVRVLPAVQKFFADLAPYEPPERARLFANLVESIKQPAFRDSLLRDSAYNYMLHDTVSITMLQIVARSVAESEATPSPWNSKMRPRPPRTPRRRRSSSTTSFDCTHG
jgi:hypothetical protein